MISKIRSQAHSDIKKFVEARMLNQVANDFSFSEIVLPRKLIRMINNILEAIFDVHISRSWKNLKEKLNHYPNYLIKLASIEFEEVSNEELEEVYEMLGDSKSKEIFEWFVRFRTAYAYLSWEANKLYPPPINLSYYKVKPKWKGVFHPVSLWQVLVAELYVYSW